MKEYYCLLLNNCYDLGMHWVCPSTFSMAPDILEKDISDLYLLENEFMDLDDMIITNEDSYHVLGGFPVFGEIKEDGKMHDVITGKLITAASNSNECSGLSYRAKYPADSRMASEMLTLITEKEKERYTSYLENLEEYSRKIFYGAEDYDGYLTFKLSNAPLTPNPVIGKKVNGNVIDAITKERIYPEVASNVVTSRLCAKNDTVNNTTESQAISYQVALIISGLDQYNKYINEAKQNSISKYNSYKSFNAKQKVKR